MYSITSAPNMPAKNSRQSIHAAVARRTGWRRTARNPSAISARMSGRGRYAAAGSGAAMLQTKIAEIRKETASIRMARGAVKIPTSQPATPNPATSATEALAESLLLPSTRFSRPINDGK